MNKPITYMDADKVYSYSTVKTGVLLFADVSLMTSNIGQIVLVTTSKPYLWQTSAALLAVSLALQVITFFMLIVLAQRTVDPVRRNLALGALSVRSQESKARREKQSEASQMSTQTLTLLPSSDPMSSSSVAINTGAIIQTQEFDPVAHLILFLSSICIFFTLMVNISVAAVITVHRPGE